ncbi:MAG TPA: thiol reductant ABC exporter subunit CydC [Roseiarcus sp.]|nr:thiol reductant ABC exporter subunit CydC [Roseiarcus sp.]
MRRELWGLARPYLGWIALSVVAAVVAALAGAGLMAVSGGFIAAMAVAGAAGQEMNYYTPSALVRLFAILRTGARYGERVIGHEATLRIVAEARAWLFARLAPLAPGGLDDLRSGEALARLKTDIDRLETAFLRVAAPLATATIVTLAIATFVALYDARLAGLLLALALAAGVALPLGFLGPLRRAAKARAQLDGERRAALVDTLDGLADLVMAGRFAASAAAAEAMSTRQSRSEERERAAVVWMQAAVSLAGDAALIGALALGAMALAKGRLAGPDVSMLTLLIASAFEPLAALPAAFAALPVAAASIERVLELAHRKPLVAEPSDPAPAPAGFAIAFDHVRFGYGARAVLDDVSLRLAEGERAAIVGPSGAGKTTLIELLLRVRDPQAGAVSIGGVAANRLRLEDLRAAFAVAPQFPHLFDRSLADNLRFGRPRASEAELREALDLVGLTPLLARLPDGLDAHLGPLGARLSAGEARRIAVARAWLAERRILVLDEPTEGLDADSETRLVDAVLAASPGRTVIAVTHSAEARARFPRALVVDAASIDASAASAQ